MLLGSLIENKILKPGAKIIANRPFDTTKGHIGASKLFVKALNPMASPSDFYAADSVFMGNIDPEIFDKEKKFDALLMTLTDNGGGG